jgi:hypothetical protein
MIGRSLAIIVRSRNRFGSRPFVKDREETSDVLDYLPSVLVAQGPAAARMPQADRAID